MIFLESVDRYFWGIYYGQVTSNRLLNSFVILISLVLIMSHVCPLKHLPGPWITRIIPLKTISTRAIRGKYLLKLHQKYGPVVRIGPSNISVQGAEAVQLVYGRESKWVKPPYEPDGGKIALSSHGLIGLPGVNDRKCRKLLETCFSEKAIAKQQGVILNCVDTALTVTEIACEGDEGKVDILQIARTYAFDVITEILYGGSWQGRGTHSERKAHLTLIDQATPLECLALQEWISPFPLSLFETVFERLPSGRKRLGALEELQKISKESITAYLEDLSCKPGSSRGCIQSLLQEQPNKKVDLDPESFTSLALPLIASAVDSICAVLTFAVWDLARFPDFRKRVAEEVAKFFPSREDMTAVGLEELPFLNAFLKESMRFHSISVSSNRRVSPAEGAAILGHHLPGRTETICDSYCQAMDPVSFPSPENFDPERWLCSEAREWFGMTMAYSYGRRTCLGKSLAETTVRFAVAGLLFDYDFQTYIDNDLDTIKDLENNIVKPWRRKLYLTFTPRLGGEEDLDLQGYSIIDP